MSDIEKVKQLRQATGAGFKDCNSAIQEANGDLEKAADLFSDTIISDDGKEGFESFFEKRSPNWRND